MRALIIDDEMTSLKLVESFLSGTFECDLAGNGEDAFDTFLAAFDADMAYHLICVDVKMPQVDGIEFLQAVRQFEHSKGIVGEAGVKVIFVSGVMDPQDVHAAMSAGCVAYLTKPLNRQKFLSELERLGMKLQA